MFIDRNVVKYYKNKRTEKIDGHAIYYRNGKIVFVGQDYMDNLFSRDFDNKKEFDDFLINIHYQEHKA